MVVKPRYVTIVAQPHEVKAVRIVGDAGIAHPDVAEGRMIPVVIVDTSDRPDIDEMIKVHEHLKTGDLIANWSQRMGHPNEVELALTFVRPVEIKVFIEFDLTRNHGMLVEGILAAKALYLQAGREGDRLGRNIKAAKVIMGIPDTGFRDGWEKIYLNYAISKFKMEGMSRTNAKRSAKEYISNARSMAEFTMSINA
jgi:hypothetical protein